MKFEVWERVPAEQWAYVATAIRQRVRARVLALCAEHQGTPRGTPSTRARLEGDHMKVTATVRADVPAEARVALFGEEGRCMAPDAVAARGAA